MTILKFLEHVFGRFWLDAAKINGVQRISFASYEGYKMPQLHFFNFPECKFALGILHNTEGNFDKQT